MSSYFDRMAQVLDDRTGVQFVKLVRDQYRSYLAAVGDQCLVRELRKVDVWRTLFDTQFSDEKIAEADHSRQVSMVPLTVLLQDMHTFAHDFGTAGIRLRGGRRAGDNPLLVVTY